MMLALPSCVAQTLIPLPSAHQTENSLHKMIISLFTNTYHFKSLFILFLIIFGLGFTPKSQAYEVSKTSVVARFDTTKKKYRIVLTVEINPSKTSADDNKSSPLQTATSFLNKNLKLYMGEKVVKPQSKSRLLDDVGSSPNAKKQRVTVLVTQFGDIPEGIDYFTLWVSPDAKSIVSLETFKDGKPGLKQTVVNAGDYSPPLSVLAGIESGLPLGVAGNAKGTEQMQNPNSSKVGQTNNFSDLMEAQAGKSGLGGKSNMPSEGWLQKIRKRFGSSRSEEGSPGDENRSVSSNPVKQFAMVGARIFFSSPFQAVMLVFCFFFFSPKPSYLGRQVATFTIAYTAALLLTVFGAKYMPQMTGNMLMYGIPLAIIFLAIENLFADELHWWRQGIVAISGFLLGMAFSNTLNVAGIGSESLVVVFIGYNIGIGLAQLLILLVLGVCLSSFWKRPWYRRYIAIPVSVIIAVIALFQLI